MSVDLNDLVDLLKAEVNAPGEDNFPDATDSDWLNQLLSGFWSAVLDGLIVGYSVNDDGIVSPVSGTTDLKREFQQMIVFYSGMTVVRNSLRSINTMTHSVAGPVEFQVEKSANTLRDILKELQARRNILLERFSDLGMVPSVYIDAVLARNDATLYGDSYGGFSGDRTVGGGSWLVT